MLKLPEKHDFFVGPRPHKYAAKNLGAGPAEGPCPSDGAGVRRARRTYARRPAINALVTAGDAPSISARSCFSCHLGPGPRI